MIPASLQRVIERREPVIATLTWRDGSVLRQNRDGTWRHFTNVQPITDQQPQPQEDDDNPFPP